LKSLLTIRFLNQTMILINYKDFEKLSILEKAELLEKNNIFKSFDRNLINSISEQDYEKVREIFLLVDNEFTRPTEKALKETFHFLYEEGRKLLEGEDITEIEDFYKEKFYKETKELEGNAILYYLNKLRKKVRKRFKKSESILFQDIKNIEKIQILEFFKSHWLINRNNILMRNRFENKNRDILNFYVLRSTLKKRELLSLLDSYEELNFAIGTQRTLDFLRLKKIEIKSKHHQKNEVSNNKYPNIFASDFAHDVFFACLKNEIKLTKRIFSIYLLEFQTKKLIYDYRGIKEEYKKMIKKEFQIPIDRIESDIPKDLSDKLGEIQAFIKNYKKANN
jgi:hypothetical protein